MAGTDLINADQGLSTYVENKNALKCMADDWSYVFYAYKEKDDSSSVQIQFERLQGFDVLNKTTGALDAKSFFYKDFFGVADKCENGCTNPEGFSISNSWTKVDSLLPGRMKWSHPVASFGATGASATCFLTGQLNSFKRFSWRQQRLQPVSIASAA